MLSLLRHLFIDSWVGRVLVGIVFVVFVGWGVGDIFTNFNSRDANTVAWVGSRKISITELDSALRNQLPRIATQQGYTDASQLPADIRSAAANELLQQMISQNLVVEQANKNGIVVPDEMVRKTVFSLPDFQRNGQFDRALLNEVLSRANLSENQFLTMVRDGLAEQGLIDPLHKGSKASEILIKRVFDFNTQTRTMTYVQIPFSHFKVAPVPTQAVLFRYYQNHPWEFKIPEQRRVRLIILSPDTIAHNLEVPEADLKQYYNAQINLYQQPETRGLQLITLKDQAKANTIETLWKSGATWQQIQIAAKGSAVVEMPDVRENSIPSPQLGKLVFSAPINQIQGPQKLVNEWVVFRVNKITPPHNTSFEEAKEKLRQEIASVRASQLISERVRKIQDILAGGAGLDSIPGDLGVAAVEGTLDEKGMTPEGEPAPFPADDKLRQEVLIKIFSTAKNTPPVLIQGSGNAYYAFTIENIFPTRQKTFDEAKKQVIHSWQQNDQYRQANQTATKIYLEVSKEGKGINQIGLSNTNIQNASFSRLTPTDKLPKNLQLIGFGMHTGDSTMVESPDGFVVATLTNIDTPTEQEKLDIYQRLQEGLNQSIGDDIEQSYLISLQANNKKVHINQAALDLILKQVNSDQ